MYFSRTCSVTVSSFEFRLIITFPSLLWLLRCHYSSVTRMPCKNKTNTLQRYKTCINTISSCKQMYECILKNDQVYYLNVFHNQHQMLLLSSPCTFFFSLLSPTPMSVWQTYRLFFVTSQFFFFSSHPSVSFMSSGISAFFKHLLKETLTLQKAFDQLKKKKRKAWMY